MRTSCICEGYRKVWARLRHAGLRTSKERVRRLMRENGLAATTRTGRPRGPRSHDGTIIPEVIDTMWGTDMAAAFTLEHGQRCFGYGVKRCREGDGQPLQQRQDVATRLTAARCVG